MHLFSIAYDDLTSAINEVGGFENLTPDQKLSVAQTKALLSISQELSGIHHQGINPDWSPVE